MSTFAQAYAADTIIKLLSYEKPFFFVGKQGEKSPEFCLFLQKKEGYFLTLDFTTENHKKQGFFTVIQYKKEIEKRMQKAERSRGRRGAPRSESKISMLAGGKHTLIIFDAPRDDVGIVPYKFL